MGFSVVKKLSFVIFIFGILLSTYTSQSLASTYAPHGYGGNASSIYKITIGTVDFPSQCTISYSSPPLAGMPSPALCSGSLQCRPVPGYGTTCVEAPAPGSVENGSFCYSNSECASGYCFHPPGSIGSATCQTKCGPSNCSGGCVVTTTYSEALSNPNQTPVSSYPFDTNQCVLPTATPTSPPAPCNEGSQCSTGYCDTTTHTCRTAPTATPTATCASNGIKSLTYDKNGCFNSFQQAKSATVTCNDGTVKTFTSSFGCVDTIQFQSSALNFCSSHKTCPLPTPTNTLTPTPSPRPQATNTPTPHQLACDPDPTGTSANKIDNADFELWKKEYSHQVDSTKTDCFVHDNKVDLLDFQVWKDIYVTHIKQEF